LSVGQVPKVRALRLGANLGSHNLQFKKVFSTIADSKKERTQPKRLGLFLFAFPEA
jgi:hypothetical protein